MVELSDELVTEVKRESTTTDDLLGLVERHHDETQGVRKEVIRAYADRLEDERDYAFDAEGFLAEVDDRLTDSEEWVADDALYELDEERMSRYPARWHEELGGSTDPTGYVEYLQTEEPEYPSGSPDTDRGVPKRELEDIMSIVGRVTLAEARDAIETQRKQGGIEEDSDQHRNAGVYLAGEAE